MKKQTRQVFGQYETRLGQLNDTDNVAKTFSVTPSVQQKLENKMQESSEFLSKVNIIGVGEQEGEKLGLGVRTRQHDTVDALVWRYVGDGAGYVEQTLEMNPALARHSAVLPAGLVVTLPEPASSTGQVAAADLVQLWD